MSKELTEEQVRENFLDHVRGMSDYWNNIPKPKKECLDGLAFSLLVLLDGGTGLPGFRVYPNPHPDDKQYSIDEGEDYYPTDCDIAGSLHELYYKKQTP